MPALPGPMARVMAPHGQRSNERGRPLPAPWVLRMPASLRARALLSFIAREYRTDRCFMSIGNCKLPPGILRVFVACAAPRRAGAAKGEMHANPPTFMILQEIVPMGVGAGAQRSGYL